MFCFIDQMPKGMRETLYFKDDDSRLSFLQGNYITLTNMSDHDVERIVKYRLEPINISFQTTNPQLRCKMLHNRFAGEALKKVDILYRGQIEMNGQIVLCKGVNDGEELERTIRDLTGYLPYLKSVSIVPVGLTKYRDGLYPLEPFTKEDAREVLSVIHRWQEKIYQEHGIHMIHAGDEWYVLAEEEVPEEERYDGYLQLENGVGMMRLLFNEVQEALSAVTGDERQREISLATGRLMYPYIGKILEEIRKKFPNITTHLYAIRNDFFGERMLAGLEKPTKGEVIIDGQHIENLKEDQLVRFRREKVGFIFQSFQLLGSMNALENVALPLSFRGVPKAQRLKKADKMLDLVKLKKHKKHLPNQMSGGQQQRVGVARALVVDPKIIFADEPTGNLDSRTSREVMALMQQVVREQKKTLVMVTHDDHLAGYADRIFHIIDGKIVKVEDNRKKAGEHAEQGGNEQ